MRIGFGLAHGSILVQSATERWTLQIGGARAGQRDELGDAHALPARYDDRSKRRLLDPAVCRDAAQGDRDRGGGKSERVHRRARADKNSTAWAEREPSSA